MIMEWEIVMGLEVHVELATKTKIFCSCTTEFGGEPNTHCCPVCTGMPGVLPVLNEKVVEYSVKAGLALNCKINLYNKFDRKNYFYPDLPKAYQISQLYLPFAQNGYVDITNDSGSCSTIRIHEIHMEEDACKLIHSPRGNQTFPDYNRCGIPLIEIVSEPDFRHASEVIAYLTKLKGIFEYLGISDCKLEEGSMRADVNLSVRPRGSNTFGTRTEMKNINSFKAIERAIAYESERQIDLLESGQRVIQQTLRWDDNIGETIAMRSKENAEDYRYFPEPDIPPIYIDEKTIDNYIADMPEFPDQKVKRYVSEWKLSQADAEIIASSKHLARLFEETTSICKDADEVRFWIINQVLYFINERNLKPESIPISASYFAEFIGIVKSGKVNRQIGKQIFEKMLFGNLRFDIEKYIKDNNLEQVENTSIIMEVVNQIISDNPKAVEQYKNGQSKIISFFIGQAMKQLKGKGNPAIIKEIILGSLSDA